MRIRNWKKPFLSHPVFMAKLFNSVRFSLLNTCSASRWKYLFYGTLLILLRHDPRHLRQTSRPTRSVDAIDLATEALRELDDHVQSVQAVIQQKKKGRVGNQWKLLRPKSFSRHVFSVEESAWSDRRHGLWFSNWLVLLQMFSGASDVSQGFFYKGNMDRHHIEKMTSLSNESFIIHLDNGRAFGRAFHDEMSILAPLTQCCLIRYSTFSKLKTLFQKKFSELLDESLRMDPLYPILTDGHLKAIDRRMDIIIGEVLKCTKKYSIPQVIIDDGY